MAATTSRAELRRRIADRLGDLLICTATAAGTTTTFTDAYNLLGPDAIHTNRDAVFTAGANSGQTVRVSGSSGAQQTVTFSQALPQPVAQGDVVELYNERNVGWRIAQYHRFLNECIDMAFPATLVDYVANSAAPYSNTAGTIAIPAGFTHLYRVERLGSDGYWVPLHRARREGADGYWVDKARGLVALGGDQSQDADGETLRFSGYQQPPQLATDAATTTVNAEWLVMQCCALMLFEGVQRVPERQSQAAFYQRAADALRPRLRTPRMPNTEEAA